MKVWDLTLNGDTFNALKTDFNAILRRTLANMETHGIESADISIKLKVTLYNEQAPDLSITAYEAKRDIIVPRFEHKVTSVFQTKDEVSGILAGRYELVWDKDRSEYVMQEIRDNQMRFDDFDRGTDDD